MARDDDTDQQRLGTDQPARDRSVGEVADLFRVTVRTLHHWEEIGLISPSGRTWSGYRQFSPEDCERIQQVLIYRATGMPLKRIAEVIADPSTRAIDHLREQRRLLENRLQQLEGMVAALDALMEDAMTTDKTTNTRTGGAATGADAAGDAASATRRGDRSPLSVEQRAQILGDAQFPVYAAEAEDRWGGTDDWAVSQKRADAMTADDWAAAKAGTDQLEADLAGALAHGVEPGSDEASAQAHGVDLSALRWE